MSENILFVCKHNRFRSKVAEAFFKRYNKNESYKAYSAGLLPGGYPLDKIQIKVAKEFGINLKGKPKPISMDLLVKTNIVVIVADNVPSEIFHNKKYSREEIVWKIADTKNNNPKEVYDIIKKIEKRVEHLVESLHEK